jgi:biopolymer transport protein ExbB
VLGIIIAELSTFGGPVLITLFLASVVALATTIFKVWQFFRLGVGNYRAWRAAGVYWSAGDRVAALQLVSADRSLLSNVVATAMSSLAYDPDDVALARQMATQTALESLNRISSHLRILEAVVQAAPMLGLLGTVIGMIEAFGKVAQGGGAADSTALAGGIWIALTTTAAGLTVAIPFYFASVWLESRVDRERAAMDAAITEVTFRA